MAKRIIKDIEKEVVYIKDWIQKYFANNGDINTKAVIGISGGKDSTIVAYLCAAALGPERVIGVKMPQGKQYDIDMADKVIQELGIKSYEINIKDTCNAFYSALATQGVDITKVGVYTNTPPRIRMAVLYAIAADNNGRVANTSNLSERTVGWSTKWGDGVGDFAPLADYTVEEVKQLGEALSVPADLLYKNPEDGLTGKSDEENLGVTYEQIDQYIRGNENPQPYEAYKIIEDKEKAARHKWINITHPIAQVEWDEPNINEYYF